MTIAFNNTSVAHPVQSGHVWHKIKQSPIYSGSKENLLLNIKLEPSHYDLQSNLKCVSYIVWAVLQIFPLVVREPPAIKACNNGQWKSGLS